MASEHNANSRAAGSIENVADPCDNLSTVLDLTDNTHLHVIDDQGQPSWIVNIVQCFRDIQAESSLHIPLLEECCFRLRRRNIDSKRDNADALFTLVSQSITPYPIIAVTPPLGARTLSDTRYLAKPRRGAKAGFRLL